MEAFISVIETGSFSSGACRMKVGQPAVRRPSPNSSRSAMGHVEPAQASALDLRSVSPRQLPVRANEMAGVTIRDALKIILMLRFGFPELAAGATSVTTRPGHKPDALTSAIVSSAVRRCSSLV
jgi:hypothetical protein